MFCKNCGQQIDGVTTNYCPNCGENLNNKTVPNESPKGNASPATQVREVPVGKIMGKFICLIFGIGGIICSLFLLVESHKEWESHVKHLFIGTEIRHYTADYFWSYGNETWFSYAPMGFILLAASIIVFVIGCCIKGNIRK